VIGAAPRPLPLAGLRVLDLGQIYQGPYCGFLLAMAGAEVIKVEPPDGDPLRFRQDDPQASSMPLAMLNAGKRGITLNLKSAAGRSLLLDLVDESDVVLENFAPGVMDRLGVGAAILTARNPRLIYASANGYGSEGLYRDVLAMDLTVQAMAGMMSVTGFEDGPPLKSGAAVCDFLGGAHLYGAITTALYERERTGRGRVVEVAMLDAAYPALASNLDMMHKAGGAVPPRTGNRHGGLAMAPYNVYPTRDGYIAVICVKDSHWRILARLLGREELANDPAWCSHEKRAARMQEVDALMEQWTQGLSSSEIFALSREHRFPAAPVRTLHEVAADPHLHARGMVRTVEHPRLGSITLPGSPLRFEGSTAASPGLEPTLGADQHAVLAEILQRDPEAIAAMRAAGAF
jgi:crotonobetainyl-CoA:carnitine CoA-transferase CaiB-like acyl-CoA transferase